MNKIRRVLVVEDEILVAMNTEDALLDMGCEETKTATSFDQAMRMAEDEPLDLAILDVNLNGIKSFPVAEVLNRRGIPFLFATGYGVSGIDEALADAPVLKKPFQTLDLKRAINAAVARAE